MFKGGGWLGILALALPLLLSGCLLTLRPK